MLVVTTPPAPAPSPGPVSKLKAFSLSGALAALVGLLYKYVPTADWDHLRHWLAYVFNADATGPNIGAWVYCGVLAVVGSVIVWPKARRAVENWLHGHLGRHFGPLEERLAQILESLAEKELSNPPPVVKSDSTSAPPAPGGGAGK